MTVPRLWGFITRDIAPRNDTPGSAVYDKKLGGVCAIYISFYSGQNIDGTSILRGSLNFKRHFQLEIDGDKYQPLRLGTDRNLLISISS